MENAVKIFNSDLPDSEKFEQLCELREGLDIRMGVLKKHKADIDYSLMEIAKRSPEIRSWENQGGTSKIEVKEGFKYLVNKKQFLELLSIPGHVEKFLASGWFKIGEIKKLKALGACWHSEKTGSISVEKTNPEIIDQINYWKAADESAKKKKTA